MTPRQLKAARKRLGWTQVQLAEALGVYPMTVSKWERAVQPIPQMAAIAVRCFDTHGPTGAREE